MTTNSKRESAIVELKALLEDDEDRLRVLLQELLEQEMAKALAATLIVRVRGGCRKLEEQPSVQYDYGWGVYQIGEV